MTDSLLRHTRPLLALATMGLLLAGCGDGSSPTAADPDEELSQIDDGGEGLTLDDELTLLPGEPNPATPLTDVEGLVLQLQQLGLDATYQGQSLEQSFLFPSAHLISIEGEDVRVYLYDTIERLKEDAAKISIDGGTLAGTPVRWMAPPRFYARGTFLALYVGVDEAIVAALDSLFGRPFAGHGATVHEPGIPGDGSLTITEPALIVATTIDEVERLAPYVSDEIPAAELAAIDLTQSVVVAVFRGQQNTAGYAVEIETVGVDAAGQVIVEVSLTDPGSDDLVAQVITYPLDVKVVSRQDVLLPEEAKWMAQTADGRQLATYGLGSGPVISDPLPLDPSTGDDTGDEPVPVEPDGGIGDGAGPIPVEPDSGIGTTPDDEPFRLADIRGTITEVEVYDGPTASGIERRLLVQGAGTDDTVYDIAWVEIFEATELSFDGETFAPPTTQDLAVGRQVEIRFTGTVRESYPVQAVAEQVMIFR
jgi:hypothetical protein